MVSIGRAATGIAATAAVPAWPHEWARPTLVSVSKTPVSAQERTYRQRLGATIVQLRAIHDISQARLAEMVERSEAAVSRWETGKATPSAFDLRRMADVFGLGVDLVDLLVFPLATPASPVAERLGVTQPRPEFVPTADEVALTAKVVRSGAAEAMRRDRNRTAGAPPAPPGSPRPPAPAKRA